MVDDAQSQLSIESVTCRLTSIFWEECQCILKNKAFNIISKINQKRHFKFYLLKSCK